MKQRGFKLGVSLALVGAAVGLGIGQPATAHAKSWLSGTTTHQLLTQPNGDANSPSLYATSVTTKKAYMWNLKHTKKIHNLNNYPKTSWYLVGTVTKPGKGVYYQVTTYDKKIKGLVWNKYLTAYSQKTPRNFKSAAAYTKFIQTDPSQKLTRAVLKVFPNVPLDFQLSKYTATRFDSFPTSISGYKNMVPISTFSLDPSDFKNIQGYTDEFNLDSSNKLYWYWQVTYGQPVAGRIAKLQEALASQGWTAEKIANLDSSWRLGVCLVENGQIAVVLAQTTK
ncbi:hypothetical protein [Levilactobacillus wangkuiensis]|uniref:hypothetical protein n=1 Tax=Levilactobacillus wangkuiensis TaxID=2799566 RepID=UPI0019455C5D|nr:hypothetical protein [Levilactobacillus wangkuiensis]